MTDYSFGAPSVADPVDDTPSTPSTVWDIFAEEIQKDPDVPDTIDLKVRGRDAFKVRFRTNMSLEKLEAWRKAATPNKRKPEDINAQLLSLYIINGQCEGLVVNGELVLDKKGEPLDFRNPVTQEQLNVLEPHAAILKFYPNDSDLVQASNQISRACGYDLDGNEVDDDPLV